MIETSPRTRLWSPFFLLLLGLTIALPAGALGSSPMPSSKAPSPPTTVVHSDETGLTFTVDLPYPAEVTEDGRVSLPGLDQVLHESGKPALPYVSTLIALPPNAGFNVTVKETAATILDAPRVAPAATIDLLETPDLTNAQPGLKLDYRELTIADAELYSRDALYPPQTYRLSPEQYAGDLRFVRLDLFPLRVNPAAGELRQAQQMTVQVKFTGAELNEDQQEFAVAAQTLIADMLNTPPISWRTTIPQSAKNTNMSLPVGVDTYKILVDTDGLYRISGSDLAAAGMNLAEVDPATIHVMNRGEAVAYQFVDKDGQPAFGPSDEIRFFGWAFDGSRFEDLYVTDNVFWLWAGGGAGERVAEAENESGQGYAQITNFPEEITKWPHNNYFEGWALDWDTAANEATAWYWERLNTMAGESKDKQLPIDLPDPALDKGGLASVLVEISSQHGAASPDVIYNVETWLNDSATSQSGGWENAANVNIELKTPLSDLLAPGETGYPTNEITVEFSVPPDEGNNNREVIYVTRATVAYSRHLKTINDELLFRYQQGGKHEFLISGYTAEAEPIIWDVSEQRAPVALILSEGDVGNDGGGKQVNIGRTHGADARIIATSVANLRAAKSISKYVPQDLTPPAESARWVAVAHASLLPAAKQLAEHRGQFSGMSTWVVDLEDVVNQVGFGINTPDAVRNYLRAALAEWQEKPDYLVLFGDATVNPRQLDCQAGCREDWDKDKPTLLPTGLLFVDRFNGLIPVDYVFSLLVGDDLYPDLQVARVPAEKLAQASDAVRKIVAYDQSVANPTARMENVLFVADNPDGGGNFCAESHTTAEHVLPALNSSFLCLSDPSQPGNPPLEEATQVIRDDLNHQINNVGMSILNYRGHGGVRGWANPQIMHISDAPIWQNVGEPVVILSADCLDGHFAKTEFEGLGETILELDNRRGSAAHWSSSGLGFSFEHSVLHTAFYDGLYKLGKPGIGDAVNYAKTRYINLGYDPSEVYAFTLLGDPAMSMYGRWTVQLPVTIGN